MQHFSIHSSKNFFEKLCMIIVTLIFLKFDMFYSFKCRIPNYRIHRPHIIKLNRILLNRNVIKMQSTTLGTDLIEWPVSKVRSQFIDYFTSRHKHINYKSSPVVPYNDPTLLFANAGMNQFKPIFIGTVDPSSPLAELQRAVNSQKCIRAGGKHNDLEDVGKDTYHHTFFEMLGTWSFGNYFKTEAIEWAYDILVNVYKLPSDRLYASYFGGDESLGLAPDIEARDLWLKYLPSERVLPFDKKANFWEMGESGPCGPCSEVHFDRIGNRDASKLVNADDPDVIEIWNLVFIQFNRELSGELRTLPDKHIDTGMGLERLTSILQNKRSNYDTDVFAPIFNAIQDIIGCAEYSGKLGLEDAQQNFKDTAYRVIADHIRTLTFAITDGAVPSNEGRGYVLRRILRRAVRYGMQTLGARPGFFSQLVPTVVNKFGTFYPELIEKQEFVTSILQDEERSFTSLLERGVKYFNEIIKELQSSQSTTFPGERAFYLYDSLGFPIDLTQLMAAELGFTVDVPAFVNAMNSQKERSRTVARAKTLAGIENLSLGAEQTSYLQKLNILPTDDSSKYLNCFDEAATSTPKVSSVKAVYTKNGFKSSISYDDLVSNNHDEIKSIGFILDSTPFYAEAGGQVADNGQLVINFGSKEIVFDVVDVQSFAGYSLHICIPNLDESSKIQSNEQFSVNDAKVTCQVNFQRRRKIVPNHTMTHVLNFALREVLTSEIDQKGSLVSDEKLRFDFSLNRAMKSNEIEAVELKVNQVISQGYSVSSKTIPLAEAKSINGLRAVFGEVYPDPVRVISVGAPLETVISDPSLSQWREHSIEFCGGTHLSNTQDAKAFVIIEETAVAKGVRRITGMTGDDAKEVLSQSISLQKSLLQLIEDMKVLTSSSMLDVSSIQNIETKLLAIRSQLDEGLYSYVIKSDCRNKLEKLQKDVATIKEKISLEKAEFIIQDALVTVRSSLEKEESVVILKLNGLSSDAKVIKKALDDIRKVSAEKLSFLCIGIDHDSQRINLFAFSNEASQSKGLLANEWINNALAVVNCKGGGRPNVAQGSCNDITKVDILVESATNTWKTLLHI